MTFTASKRTLAGAFVFLLAAMAIYFIKIGLTSPRNVFITATVRRGDIENSVLATGKLDAIERVNVGAQVTGEIKSLPVKVGDRVKKGQLIAEIDDLQQRNDLRNAEAALNVMRANKLAKQASLQQAGSKFAREKRMLKEQASSREDFEVAEMQLKTMQAELMAIDAGGIQAQIEVDKKKLDLSYTKVLAPRDGIVISVIAQQGQTLNASQNAPTIIKLAKLDIMTIKAQISEADITRMKPGQKAYFSIFSEPSKRYEATLRLVELAPESIMKDDTAPSSTTTSTQNNSVYYNALLDVPNVGNQLRIAMTVQVTFPLKEAKSVLLAPVQSVKKVNGQRQQVEVLGKNNEVQQREVETGISNGVDVEIIKGLKLGDVLILNQSNDSAGTREGDFE
ncbi:hemolysin secretion protein D [Serratia sp. Leaf50]|nr:hemolysin secretion protein D [Serratia sp. Leaf50]